MQHAPLHASRTNPAVELPVETGEAWAFGRNLDLVEVLLHGPGLAGLDFKPMTSLQPHLKSMLAGCIAVLLPLLIGPVIAAENQLLLRPSQERFSSGDRIWWLEWRQGKQLLQRWAAASGAGQSQGLDRRWSPGNGAPLPAGTYDLGRPEPWGRALWIGLEPRFSTRRSGLGIHHCFPGVGCICLPQRRELDQLASLIRRHDIRRLVVLQ